MGRDDNAARPVDLAREVAEAVVAGPVAPVDEGASSMPSATTWPLRVVISSPVMMRRSSPHRPCHARCAELVLCSEVLMKSRPAARASAAIRSGVRPPSECTECRWQSPRYQARPRPLARGGG